ncbi:hypothetical protein P8452_07743 [Trifolium repens]|nr:hypothetical protein P8452_07743 [Trifolium repens]
MRATERETNNGESSNGKEFNEEEWTVVAPRRRKETARFAKEEGGHKEHGGNRPTMDGRNKESVKKTRKQNESPSEKSKYNGWDRTKTGNLSYADAAGRQTSKNGEGQRNSTTNNSQKTHEAKREWRGLSFETNEEDRAWARKGLIGLVKHVDEVPLLQQKILDIGITTVKIIPMGGRKVFLQPVEDEDLSELIKDAEEFFNHWFVKIKEWSPKEVSSDRAIWIRLYGVPVHAWRENFFKKMLELTGEVIVMDDDTINKRRFDYARVLIRTSALSFINQLEKVKIDEDVFVVRMLEEVSFCPNRAAGNQKLLQSEDEESTSQRWNNQCVEEEEEGEVNSQNLEREYCAFNEHWEEEKNSVSGGVVGEFQEKSFNSTTPKTTTQSVVGDRERKEYHVASTKHGTHFSTNDPLYLVNIGVLFPRVKGSAQKPIGEVHSIEKPGLGSNKPTQNYHTDWREQNRSEASTSQSRTQDGAYELQQHNSSNSTTLMNFENQERLPICPDPILTNPKFSIQRAAILSPVEKQVIDIEDYGRVQQCNSDPQEQQIDESSTLEKSMTQNQVLSAKVNSTTNQTEEQNMDNLKKRRRRRITPKMKDLARAKAIRRKKRKINQAKNSTESNENPLASESMNQVNISTDSTCSKEISEWRKWVLLHDAPNEVASKVWEYGRKEGVSYSDDEGGVVKELEGIEIRDREKIEENNMKSTHGGESIFNGL